MQDLCFVGLAVGYIEKAIQDLAGSTGIEGGVSQSLSHRGLLLSPWDKCQMVQTCDKSHVSNLEYSAFENIVLHIRNFSTSDAL